MPIIQLDEKRTISVPKQENQITLMNGEIVIFQREDSKKGTYYVRIKDKDGSAIIKSTKTANIDFARKFAIDFFIDSKAKISQGVEIRSPIVSTVFNQWIDEYWRLDDRFDEKALNSKEVNKKNNRFRLIAYQFRKYILPFMGKLKITEINSKLILDYTIHRSKYYKERPDQITPLTKTTPSITTVKMELTAIRQLLKYALLKGYVSSIPVIDIPKSAVKLAEPRVRSGISKQEYELLMEHEENKFYKEEEIKILDSRHRRQRHLICRLIEFVSKTYLRAGEALNVKWSDLFIFTGDDNLRYIKLIVRDGKTGGRIVVCPLDIGLCLSRLKQITGKFEYLFCDVNTGRKLENPNKTIRTLFSEIGIKRRIVLYDFRHYGITQALLSGVDIYTLSRNAGTSVSHIENTYSKVLVVQQADKLSKFKVAGRNYSASESQKLIDYAIGSLGDLITEE
jgi:integrase